MVPHSVDSLGQSSRVLIPNLVQLPPFGTLPVEHLTIRVSESQDQSNRKLLLECLILRLLPIINLIELLEFILLMFIQRTGRF